MGGVAYAGHHWGRGAHGAPVRVGRLISMAYSADDEEDEDTRGDDGEETQDDDDGYGPVGE